MKNEGLMERGLPKWPQMIVTGAQVSNDQALEIIRRTDAFFAYNSGNDHAFVERAMSLVGKPKEVKYKDPRFTDKDGNVDDEKRLELHRKYWEEEGQWREDWGLLQTEYITNAWISSAFIGGPHGWCHPDGVIGYCNNVGKWPSVQDVYNEWQLMLTAFPFLELEVTLMSGEEFDDEKSPVVSFLIRNGGIQLVDPQVRNLHEEFSREVMPSQDPLGQSLMLLFSPEVREHAISLNQIEKWGAAFKATHPEYFA